MSIFKKLWSNHPTVSGYMNGRPCSKNGKSVFQNQCAIRLGHALQKSGFSVDELGVRTCRNFSQNLHDPKKHFHPLAAEELANALRKNKTFGISRPLKIDPKKIKSILHGKTGIIFFKDYWKRDGENYSNRSGDHIDLWDGSSLTGIPFYIFWSNYFHKYDNSKEIWFWKVD